MIEKRKLKNGHHVYRVRWREGGRGSKEHVRAFDRKEDAERFETDIRRRKQLGELASFEQGRQTLDEWAREWFRTYAQPTLARTTLVYYAHAWDKYVLPKLGVYELRPITPEVVAAFADELRQAGVGEPTARKVLSLLQGVLQRAVVLGHIRSNPVAPIRKPAQRRQRVGPAARAERGRAAPAPDADGAGRGSHLGARRTAASAPERHSLSPGATSATARSS